MCSSTEPDNGLVHLKSSHSVRETIARLESTLKERGLFLFGRIDHSAAAAEAGLQMRPTEVLLFGNPRGGTPMMLAAPTLAIDLPFKALVWEDTTGQVWLTYNTPEYLKRRHDVPEHLVGNFNVLASLLREVVQ
jgi:uncharacterized protein (DUF302 family)